MSLAQPLTGVHAVWSAPRRAADPGADVRPPDDEILTMIMGAMRWHEFHGRLELFADSHTAAALEPTGLLDLYDDVRTGEIDGIDPDRFDPTVYFSLPKVVAAESVPAPMVVLDLDLYLNRPLPRIAANDFVFAHRETLDRRYYPTRDRIHGLGPNELPGFDDDALACNMAIAGFGSDSHRELYASLALGLIADNTPPEGPARLATLLFAEQRIVVYAAAETGTHLRPVTRTLWDSTTWTWRGTAPDRDFYHTWSEKKVLRKDPIGYPIRCRQLATELVRCYPQTAALVRRAGLAHHLSAAA